MFCDNCGAELDLGQTYCSRCGALVTQAPPREPYQPIPSPPPQRRSGAVPALIVTCTVLVMILFGLGLVAGGVIQLNGPQGATIEQSTAASKGSKAQTDDTTSTTTKTVQVRETPTKTETSPQQETPPAEKVTEKEIVYVPVPSEPQTPTYSEPQTPTYSEPATPSYSSATNSGYVLPDSASRYYDASELTGYSNWDLYLARNEIYARHGRGFVRDDLQAYFNNCTWYTRCIEPEDFDDDAILSACEKANALTIRGIEESRGSPYL